MLITPHQLPPPTQAAPTATALKKYTSPLRPAISVVAGSATPRKLLLFFMAICVLALSFWSVATRNIAASARALQLIGKDTVPSIIAASRIGASLADAHANATDALLANGDAANEFWQCYENDLDVASEQLVGAAQNITYGDEERAPIVKMVQNLRSYTALIGQARKSSSYERAAVMQQANTLLHSALLPAAEELNAANLKHLTAQYVGQIGSARWETVSTVLAGLALLGLCIWTQSYLNCRFRRLFNLPLLLATVLLGWYLIFITAVFMNVHEDLRRAKEDAFDSTYCVWKAREAAFDAKADESLYLLTQNRSDFGTAHSVRMNELVNPEISDAGINGFERGLAPASHLDGLLIREARNVTFPGERDAVGATLHGYCHYADAWSQICALEDADKHSQAVKLCLDDMSFLQFDRGMEMLITLNQREFDSAIEDGFAGLSWLPSFTGALMLGVVSLAWMGLRARWNEYRN